MCSIRRGALIVVEGVDRSGKTTLCKKLVASLKQQNIKSELINFPDRTTPIGKVIDEYLGNSSYHLCDEAIHLLFTANRWENNKKMRDMLHKGTTLIVDRYSYSGVAFSAIKKNMDITWCKHPEKGLPKPDLVFLLHLNYEESAKRPGFGIERYEKQEVQQQVAKVFMDFSSTEDNWKVIDASSSIEELHNIMLDEVLKKVKDVEHAELANLDFHCNEH